VTAGYDSPLSGPATQRPEIPDGYYAVPDPNDPAVLTAWRAVNGHLKPAPVGAKWGPVLYKRDVAGMSPLDRQRYVSAWFNDVRWPWDRAVRAAIVADPEAAGALYAKTTVRCRDCGIALRDPVSKREGRGPDCRAKLADAVKAAAKYRGEQA
jgi:hypothetical protein